ncbi:unnamed protein product, partial [marine sediment metagenome]
MAVLKFSVAAISAREVIRGLGPYLERMPVQMIPYQKTVSLSFSDTQTIAVASAIARFVRDQNIDPNDATLRTLTLTEEYMPVTHTLKNEYEESKPFRGKNIVVNAHLKEAVFYLCSALVEGGANLFVVPVPYSGEETVFEWLGDLLKAQICAPARTSEDDLRQRYLPVFLDINSSKLDIIIEDGWWVSRAIHEGDYPVKEGIVSIEQTTAGVTDAKRAEEKGELRYPVYAVGAASLKQELENVLSTPESVLANICQAAYISLQGKVVSIAGFGSVGRGLAHLARNHGANVIVVEDVTTDIGKERLLLALLLG